MTSLDHPWDWLTHLTMALIPAIIVWMMTGNPWAGAVAGALCLYYREYMQAYYRAVRNGSAASPRTEVVALLAPWRWTPDSWGDVLVPVAVLLGAALAMTLLGA
ncbi:hypothetical protein [Pseudodesulfovibrio indicus]|uniref:Uncharacterized protein n=1 Tax=Pseudodesulfovibrio indicus TaxID=1716143 RepID=A0A140D8Z5_9BACT|nr:hypothetical protein [Pseudodesulfovibrio indicus]AMK09662.1 hypothetical protein AWY79_00330 [Pseudodesulfovibrio indicus]TDT86386.1 hypothetical protein EDC59_11362 [Pseudodesulfovibrio indicus]